MTSIIKAVMVPRTSVIPPGDIAAPEWLDTRNKANHAGTQRYDVRQWGDPFTGDAATVVQDAIDSVAGQGGGIVTGPAGDYTFTSGITLRDGVALAFPGAGATHLDFSGMTDPVNGCAMYGAGSLTALPALGAAIASNARTITFAGAPDVVPGDWLLIYNSADGSWNGARDVYRAGEYVRVRSVSGSDVTLTGPTFAGYAAGSTVSVYRMNTIKTGVSGARITLTAGVTGIKIIHGTELRFDDLAMTGTTLSHINLERSVNIALSGVHIWDASPSVGNNYGVMLANCQNVDVAGCFLETTRHGFTTGGGDYVGSVPVRNVTVRGGRISGLSDVAGCDLHGNTEYARFDGVDLPNGIHLAGDHTSVRGGRVRSRADGVGIHISETIGWSHEIDTTVDATAPQTASQALVYILGDQHNARNNGTLRIRGTFNMGSYAAVSGTTRGIYIYDTTGTGAAGVDIEIDANVNCTLPDLNDGALAVHVRAANGGGFRTVEMALRTRRMGARIECSPQRFIPRGCRIIEAPTYGIHYTTIGSPIFTQPAVLSRDNIIQRSGLTGMYIVGPGSGAGRLRSDNDEATDCNRSGGGSTVTGSSMAFTNWHTVIYRNAVVGDTLSPANQVRRDAIENVTLLVEYDVLDIGSVSTTTRTSVTTTRSRVAP